jgi:Tfp pilus assembly protein PilW
MFWIIIGVVLSLIVLGAIVFFFFSSWNPMTEFIQSFTQSSTSDVGQI